ncbi:hypothetical protein [Clostridium felsineum]|uniref:hypothetical protein n=1 Tax=Clostridium felsineum TaxID=36839 RepID=UPI00098C72B1|nr:hypothetical protein [Clostridium felsineum]URZ16897.1 hypothetical protein CLFE_029440 [Clostridium felsineum DSM 794]
MENWLILLGILCGVTVLLCAVSLYVLYRLKGISDMLKDLNIDVKMYERLKAQNKAKKRNRHFNDQKVGTWKK